MSLSWFFPKYPNGIITGFIAKFSDKDGHELMQEYVVDNRQDMYNNSFSIEMNDLQKYTIYSLSVAARTSTGSSSFTSRQEIQTLAAGI